MEFRLFPQPQSLRCQSAHCSVPAHIEHRTVAELPSEGYRLRIAGGRCHAESSDETGAFYAEQTLAQIRSWYAEQVPEMEIEDAPAFPVRGLYHDVTRGKVPTLATLQRLADLCARFRMNQLQLYIEHTYAFEAFPEVWKDADAAR